MDVISQRIAMIDSAIIVARQWLLEARTWEERGKHKQTQTGFSPTNNTNQPKDRQTWKSWRQI